MTDKRMIAVFHYDNGRCGSEPYKYEELKRGKWVWGNEKKSWHKCSVCGESAYSYYDELDDNVEELFDYCPYCGADMRAEQTENYSEKPNNCEPQIFICPIQDDYEALIEDEPQTDCKDCKYAWWNGEKYECPFKECRYSQTERSE